ALNGVAQADVAVNPTTTADGKSAVAVTITGNNTLLLAPVVGGGRMLTSHAAAAAQAAQTAAAAPCVIALSSSGGVTLSGGTSLTAPTCAVSTNASLTVPNGTSLTAASVTYGGATPSAISISNIHTGPPASIIAQSVTDPLSANSGVLAAEAAATAAASITRPAAPSSINAQQITPPAGTGGTNVSFNLQYYPTTQQQSGGCTATYQSSVWTISCPAGQNYTFSSLTVAGSLGVNFAVSGTGNTTFNFPNTLTTSWSNWTFGPANYNFLGGLSISGGSNAFTSNGSPHTIYISCNANSVLCGSNTTGLSLNSANISFQGPTNLYVNGPMTVASGNLTMTGLNSFTVISNLTFSGGSTASFTGVSTFYVGGAFNTQGSANVSFSGGTNVSYTLVGGLSHASSSPLLFQDSGIYSIGPTGSCNGSNYSICVTNNGALNFSGTDTFNISNGIYVSGGDTLTMGYGSNNSFFVGAAGTGSSGTAISLGGGAYLTLADATAFNLAGDYDATAGGGSCAILPAASIHNIAGSFKTAGGTKLGAGLYAIGGYFASGQSSGGSVSCNGATVGVQGTSVTIAYAANSTTIGSPCNSDGVCFANGFNYVNLTAPTTGTYAGLLFVGPSSKSASAMLTGGAGAIMSGAFYLPTGDFGLGGGASIASPSGGCLQIVAKTVSLAGGATAASNCITTATSTTPSPPVIVQ
ncbi:hypothetical protein GGD83_005056, partial [Rhodoblastus sphagnicola]